MFLLEVTLFSFHLYLYFAGLPTNLLMFLLEITLFSFPLGALFVLLFIFILFGSLFLMSLRFVVLFVVLSLLWEGSWRVFNPVMSSF